MGNKKSIYKQVVFKQSIALIAFSSLVQTAGADPVHLFVGADAGYSSVSGYTTTEGTRSGLQFDLKAHPSFYFGSFVFDIGPGWRYSNRSGTNTDNTNVKVITRNGYLEGSLRYRIGESGWQLGPVANYAFQTDVDLNTNPFNTTETNNAILLGASLLKELNYDSYRIRFGGRYMTDMNIANRTEHLIQLSFQIGIPLFGGGPSSPEPVAQVPAPIAQVVPAPAPVLEAVPDQPSPQVIESGDGHLKLRMDAKVVNFDVNQATVDRETAERLYKMGRFLSEHPDVWETIQISGHTDERGSDKYNADLSRRRAETVRKVLVRAGVPSEKLRTRGYGEAYPVDQGHNEAAWAINRRVEFDFYGVKNVEMITDEFVRKR